MSNTIRVLRLQLKHYLLVLYLHVIDNLQYNRSLPDCHYSCLEMRYCTAEFYGRYDFQFTGQEFLSTILCQEIMCFACLIIRVNSRLYWYRNWIIILALWNEVIIFMKFSAGWVHAIRLLMWIIYGVDQCIMYRLRSVRWWQKCHIFLRTRKTK